MLFTGKQDYNAFIIKYVIKTRMTTSIKAMLNKIDGQTNEH